MIKSFPYPANTPIKIDSQPLKEKDAQGWVMAVEVNLQRILGSATGRCLLSQFARVKRRIFIRPWLAKYSNAETGFVDLQETKKHFNDGVYKGSPHFKYDGSPYSPPETGTGLGADALVWFTPWRFNREEAVVTLLHELVHALEKAAGVEYRPALAWGFKNQGEFDAIVVENIYRAEMGWLIRKDHRSNPYPDGTATGNFMSWNDPMIPDPAIYKSLLASMTMRAPWLVSCLSHVNAPFNPFRRGALGYVPL